MKFSLITLLGFVSLAMSAPHYLDMRQTSLLATTDNFMFSISISQFTSNRNAHAGPAELDWASNGCTASPDNPFGFNFLNSCHRHDFGYRNFKKQTRFTDANKARIDQNFKKDLYNQCAGELFKGACEATATIYYEAVKAFGKKRSADIVAAREALERKMKN